MASGVAQSLLALHAESLDADFRRAALWRWVVARMPPGVRVLDAGCGTGYMTRALGRRGNPTVGLEPEPALAELAERVALEEQLDVRIVRGSIEPATLSKLGSFERILCLDVIEHIEDDVAALTALRSALAPRGRLLVSVPALPILYGSRDRRIGHFRRYSSKHLRRALEAAGLRVYELRYWNSIGIVPYAVAEHFAGGALVEGVRRPTRSALRQLTRAAIRGWLELEARTWVPLGLSLLASCSVKRKR